MALFIMTALVLLVLLYFVARDRRYLKKKTRDVVDDDMKKILNIKTEDATFPEKLEKKQKTGRPSREILAAMNEDRDDPSSV